MTNVKDRIIDTLTTPHIEVTLRMVLSMTISYIFVFADVRQVTPIETAPLMGILVPFLVMLFPTLMFAFGSLILPVFSIFLYCFISSTVLLAIAEQGGTTAYIVCFGIWAFWNCWLRWDKVQGTKVSIILIAVVFQTVLIWPTFATVQDGFVVPSASLLPDTQEALLGYLDEAIETAKSMGLGTHYIMIDSGVLQGRVAHVTIDENGSSSTYLEGGMWIVKGMWTFSGVSNPLASYQNMLVFICWLIVIVGLAVLLPPFRTMRSAVWRGMIPAALRDAAETIRLHVGLVKSQSGVSIDATPESDDAIVETKTKIAQIGGKCVYHMNALFDGAVAKYTFFEPRLLDCKPIECTGAYLSELSMLVGRVVSASVAIGLFTDREFCYDHMDQYLVAATNLETCAKALAQGNASALDDVDLSHEDQPHDTFTMRQRTERIVAVSRKWIGALVGTTSGSEGAAASRCSSKSLAALKWNLYPWVKVHISHYEYLFQFLLAPFKRSTWVALFDRESYGFVKLIWCIKYSLGMVLLLVVSVHWPAYRFNFVVADEDDPMSEAYSIQNGGWVMVAYCFATTQTAEGSVKKGLLRMAGTVTGSFSAWLALLACEDSRFERDYNIYGLVAWMTVTSFLATYIATERGFAARISLSNSFGFGPIYFVVTQIIVVTYVALYYGPEGRDEVTVNRMVANLVGIAMGIVLSVIPPANYGGDPGHTKKINNFHWHSVQSILEYVLSPTETTSNDGNSVKHNQNLHELSNKILRKSAAMHALAVDFQKDAERLQSKPLKLFCFQVDPRLKVEIGKVCRDIYVVSFIPLLAARIMESERSRAILCDEGGSVQKMLADILSDMTNNGLSHSKDETGGNFHLTSPATSSAARDDVELLIHTIQWLTAEMRGHEKALNDIKWGAF